MTHFGIVNPPYLGHLNPMLALAGELRRRGHSVTFLGLSELDGVVGREHFGFAAFGSGHGGSPKLAELKAHMAAPRGLGLFRIMGDMMRMTDLVCRQAPRLIAACGIDALLVDQLEPGGGLVAEHLGLPYVSVANALPIDREPTVPPPFTDWPYDQSPWALERNRGGYRVADLMMSGLGRTIARWCTTWSLPPRRRLDQCLSARAQVSQLIAGFDFPRPISTNTQACGPFRAARAMVGAEPFDIAPPFVFASLGTLQGGRFDLFRRIATACQRVGVRLLIAHGGGLSAGQVAALPGAPIARTFVDQRAVLAKAALAVTNGGLNTVLDALAAGVPVVAIPIAFEQGAIGARLEYCGAGRSVPLRRARTSRLAETIRRSLSDDSMKAAATRLGAEIRRAGGASAAADIVETATCGTDAEPNAGRSGRRAPA